MAEARMVRGGARRRAVVAGAHPAAGGLSAPGRRDQGQQRQRARRLHRDGVSHRGQRVPRADGLDASGNYDFRVPSLDAVYLVNMYKAGAPDVAGTTVNTLVGGA
jgi:hypothetical protein